MSNAATGNVSTETSDLVSRRAVPAAVSQKILQLLTAAGSKPTEDTSQIRVTDYNWHRPHYFSSGQLNKLDDFTRQVAAAVAEKFAQLYDSDFTVTIASSTLHFAGEILEQKLNGKQTDYYLSFGHDQEHLWGLVGIPAQSAVTWVTRLLGDSESDRDANKGLSPLEESLLLDIASAVIESLAGSLRGYGHLELAKGVTRAKPAFELQVVEEFCKIVFVVEETAAAKEKQRSEAYILMPCSKLGPTVGKTSKADNQVSGEHLSEAIVGHLQQMPVSVTARLASTVLTFEEIISLRSGDVLLLDKEIDEPIELAVEGRTFFRGQPAKSAGQQAVVITEVTCDTPHNTNPSTGT